jgi:hypothetical protein
MGIRTVCVGTKHHGEAAIEFVASLLEDDEIDLRREPDNRYDRNAVACYITGVKVGFLPAATARAVAPIMDAGTEVKCIVTLQAIVDKGTVIEPPHISVNWENQING